MPPEGGPRPPLALAAATVQIGLGLLAVLLCGYSVTYLVDPFSLDDTRLLLATTSIVLGGALFGVWLAARTRRGWLLILAVACGSLAVSTVTITVRLFARTRADDQTGIWMAIACASLDVLFWIVITVAAIIEWRFFPGRTVRESSRRARSAALVAPLALITAFVVVLVSAGPSWLIRLNSEVTAGEPVAEGQDSALTGDIRWTLELDAPGQAVALESGVAVPVARDDDHSAGVIMVDPVNGKIRWRYELRGADGAPALRPTDGGRGLVVNLGDVDDDVVRSTFTLDAGSGLAFVSCGRDWSGDRVAVAAYATQTGERLWRLPMEQPVTAAEAVDDQRLLALVDGTESCTLRVIGESGDTTLMTLAEGDRSEDPEPGSPICRRANLLRVGQNFVLQFRIVGGGSGVDRYRFIGLA